MCPHNHAIYWMGRVPSEPPRVDDVFACVATEPPARVVALEQDAVRADVLRSSSCSHARQQSSFRLPHWSRRWNGPKEGVIWVCGVGDDGVMAFTDFGIENLELITMHKEDPERLWRSNR